MSLSPCEEPVGHEPKGLQPVSEDHALCKCGRGQRSVGCLGLRCLEMMLLLSGSPLYFFPPSSSLFLRLSPFPSSSLHAQVKRLNKNLMFFIRLDMNIVK